MENELRNAKKKIGMRVKIKKKVKEKFIIKMS